ncbi:MAG: hypothetical protein ACE5D7_00810 [Fidelibacterota bacterium]
MKSLGKEWKVNPITFKQKRKLQELNTGRFDVSIVDGKQEIKLNNDRYYSLLDYVLEIGFDDYSELEKLSAGEVDEVLNDLVNHYLTVEKK